MGDVKPDLLHLGGIRELCRLFLRRVFQLLSSTLMVCSINDVVYYG